MDIREKVKNDMRKIASDGADISSFIESKLKQKFLVCRMLNRRQ